MGSGAKEAWNYDRLRKQARQELAWFKVRGDRGGDACVAPLHELLEPAGRQALCRSPVFCCSDMAPASCLLAGPRCLLLLSLLQENELEDLVAADLGTVTGLVTSLSRMFNEYMRSAWLPSTVRR